MYLRDNQTISSHSRVLFSQSSLLDNRSIQEQLPVSSFDDFLLDCAFGDESEYLNGLRLAQSMRTIHGLQIHLGIPVTECIDENEWQVSTHTFSIPEHTKGVESSSTQQIPHLSYKMTISAVARLIPNPPALVLNRKQNFVDPSLLKSSICESLFSPSVLPSIRQYSCPTKRR